MVFPIFEPEETIGQQWHRLVGSVGSWAHHPAAAARLEDVRGRLGVMFRALGGDHGARLTAAGPAVSQHRLSFRQRLGLGTAEKLEVARFDGATLELPPVLDLLPDRADNEALYEWLTAWFAAAGTPTQLPADPLQADVVRLRQAGETTNGVLGAWPGLRTAHARLAAALRAARPNRRLPRQEAAVEAAVLALLDAPGPLPAEAAEVLDPTVPLARFRAPPRYRPFLPVPLWGEMVAEREAGARGAAPQDDAGGATAAPDPRRRCRRRRTTIRRTTRTRWCSTPACAPSPT